MVLPDKPSNKRVQCAQIVIPAPCEWLNSNDRRSWAAEAPLIKMWRQASTWYARQAKIRRFDQPVQIVASVHRTDNRRSDAHNSAPTLKPVIDGLVDAGVLPDDNDEHVTRVSIERGVNLPKRTLTVCIFEIY